MFSCTCKQNSGGDDIQIFASGQKYGGEAEVPTATQEVSNDTVLPGGEEQFEKASSDMFAEPMAEAFKPAKEGE